MSVEKEKEARGGQRHEKSAASAGRENVVGARVVFVCVCAPEERKEEEKRAGKYGTLVLTHAEPVGFVGPKMKERLSAEKAQRAKAELQRSKVANNVSSKPGGAVMRLPCLLRCSCRKGFAQPLLASASEVLGSCVLLVLLILGCLGGLHFPDCPSFLL